MQIHRYHYSLVVFVAGMTVFTALGLRAADNSASSEKEKELIAVLKSDAPGGEKAIACKQLAIHGSAASVSELAKLLSNEQLASWSRIALEVIPGSEADQALTEAIETLQGRLLIGTINSIGVRRVASAVDALIKKLQDSNSEIASSAAVALGRIGNDSATKALRHALTTAPVQVRSAVAEGCVYCAERLWSDGKTAEAIQIYDEVRKADVPKQRIIEATRGAILARKQEGLPLLVELIRGTDKSMFQLALSTAREIAGTAVDEMLAAELAEASPDRASLLIQAMADRNQAVSLPAILNAAKNGPKPVRLSAISAIGRIGNVSCLSTLLEIAMNADLELAQSARRSLSELTDDKVNGEIVARLAKAEGKMLPLLLELVGQRRIEATDALLAAIKSSDKTVRSAALLALGETVSPSGMNVLIAAAIAPKYAEDAPSALQALKTAAIRMPDREACAAELADAMEKSKVATQGDLLPILGAVGGTNALRTIAAAARSSDPNLQDISSRLLGEWMTADAAPVLLDLSKTAPGDKFKTRALRGYIRIARQFILPEQERSEMCKKALEASEQAAEQKMVLEVLRRYPNTESLKLAIKAIQIPAIKDDATQVAIAIAQKLGGKSPETRELLSKIGFEKVKLEILKAEFGAGNAQKDVTAFLQKQATDLQIISLPSASYNASFGGDPAPNTVKHLKVQYRINGKTGEASFAEDSLIVLPMPK